MAGLLKEKAGVIEVDDVPLRARKRAGRVYLVMQEPGYQLFSSTVDDELASACSSDGAEDSLGNKDRIAAIKAALALEVLPTGTRSPFRAGSANGFPSLPACFRVPAR